MPLDSLSAYGARVPIHLEDLTTYVAGRELRDMEGRWEALHPAYPELATKVT